MLLHISTSCLRVSYLSGNLLCDALRATLTQDLEGLGRLREVAATRYSRWHVGLQSAQAGGCLATGLKLLDTTTTVNITDEEQRKSHKHHYSFSQKMFYQG